MTAAAADRIEKQIRLRAPRARVWRALTDPEEFGAWFGVRLAGAGRFAPGKRFSGPIAHQGYEHLTWEVTIERMEPERLLAWRWHPYAVDPSVDYSNEPTTLVVFELEEVPDGTLLTVVESGFDAIPASRRDEAYRRNGDGWAWQVESIARHLAAAS
jgi:uncharacterized protein YndB with AHSA1/START domain